MRDYRTALTSMIGSVFITASAFAADVKMSVEPQLIGLLDRAVLKIEFIDTQGDAVNIQPIDGLNIQYQGQSSSTRIINLKRSSKVIHTYLITPSKVGDFTIGPVVCVYKGGQKEVSAQLRVIKPADDKEAQELSEIMFSRITTDREAPYVHEPFNLELTVYIRDGVQIDGSFSLRGGIPESGMKGELEWKVTHKTREERNGTVFNVYTLQAEAKTLTAGTFLFRPEVQLNVVIPRQNRRPYGFDDPFFGDFFGRQETRPMVLDCNTLEIAVQPVPIRLRPPSYTGGIGDFKFEVEVGPKQVKAGEPITVRMRISGRGNISQITPPSIEKNADIKLYEARILPSKNANEVIFEQVLIPTSDSITHLPAIKFSYFNTETADFRTLTKGPFPVHIEAVPQQVAQVISAAPSMIQLETKILGRDIIYLKSAPKSGQPSPPWHRQRLFYGLLFLPALSLIWVAGFTTRKEHLAAHPAKSRRQKALKYARPSIQRAEQALRKKDPIRFYEALWNALIEYVGHHLNLSPGEVTLPVVMERIPQEAEAFQRLFNTIEQRRYGMAADVSKKEMKQLLRKFNTTLRKCERIKR